MKIQRSFKFLFLALVFLAVTGANAQTADTISTSDIEFTEIKPEADTAAVVQQDSVQQDSVKTAVPVNPAEPKKPTTLWEIFWLGFVGGLAALLLPCIYPMLPLTVSYFTKKGGTRSKAVGQAMIYGGSIIVIYVTLGILITILFGSTALNELSTNGIMNLIFFLLLIVFGISFLGAFELTLPSSFVNKIDSKSDQGGLAGIFFMAFTLALVSFSCTGPVIGWLLVDAASKGALLGPAIGMFGFSLALSLPFTAFALFPSALKALPKSGGWLNSVKVVLGFLELAFALKFLSNVDLAYHWNWLDREVFLSLWIVIFALMGLYLLGKLKFSHDSDLSYLSVPRTFLAIITFAFVVYLVPGLWGAPLKSISALVPPLATQDFNLYSNRSIDAGSAGQASSIKEKKYAELFHRLTPPGFDPYYDYDQALQASKELKKPVLLDFTGWACANCRDMESTVWTDPTVSKLLKTEFIMAELVVDDKTELPASEQYISKLTGKKIKSIGKKWGDFQAVTFQTNSQPYYVIVNSDGKVLVPPQGANLNIDNYIRFLKSGIEAFHK